MKTALPGVLLSVFLGAAMTACGDRSAPAVADPPAADLAVSDPAAPSETGAGIWTTADGNRMPYDVAGKGEVTVVLVHCWMCDRSFWDEQLPVLAERYRTIAVDLPGHGDATAARETWTVAQYGEDVAGLIRGLDLSDVVLVGHSMGGPVSLRAAALAGDKVRGIVAVDTLHDADFEFSGEQVDALISAFEADFVGTCRQFVGQMFREDGAEATMDRVRERSCDAERSRAGLALIRDYGKIDMPRWFSEAGVPIRAVNAALPNPTRIESNRQYADFDAVLMNGVGHYLHMTRPDEFNPLLLDAIAAVAE